MKGAQMRGWGLAIGGCLLWALLLHTNSAAAQPRGPADVIGGAKKARQEKELADAVGRDAPGEGESAAAAAAQPEGVAPAAAGAESAAPAEESAAADGEQESAAAEQSSLGERLLRGPQLSDAQPRSDIPEGSVVVQVKDGAGRPVGNAEVRLGILKSDGGRESVEGRTDSHGTHTFTDLPSGDQQAYRASVTAGGATVGANPFRLPHDQGYAVTLRQLKTTDDPTKVVLYIGAVSVELHDERLKLAEQVRLINIAKESYVFPEEGLLIRLPEGFTAFQTQETMGDQKVTSDEQGVRITGSLPPGQTTLLWGFDVPVEDTAMTLSLHNPFNTYAFRVLVDAVPGLSVQVDEMPPAEKHESRGASFWVTETKRRAEQGPFGTVRIHLSGIPGPGPSRWIAAGLALCVLLAGMVIAGKRAPAADPAASVRERKQTIMDQLAVLSADHERGDVGPEYFADEKARLTDAMAVLLWEEGRLSPKGGASDRGAPAA